MFQPAYHGTAFDSVVKILRHGVTLPSSNFHSPEHIEARYGVNIPGIATTSHLIHATSFPMEMQNDNSDGDPVNGEILINPELDPP